MFEGDGLVKSNLFMNDIFLLMQSERKLYISVGSANARALNSHES